MGEYLAFPIIVLALAQLAHTPFYARYALPAVAGFSILFVGILGEATGKHARKLCAIVLACASLVFALDETMRVRRVYWKKMAPTFEKMCGVELSGQLPAVVQDPRTFLRLLYYAPDSVKPRLFYLADPEESLRIIGTDLLDRALTGIARVAPVRVEPYQNFVARNPSFFFLWGPDQEGFTGWQMTKLRADGATMDVAQQSGTKILFRVKYPR